MKYFLARTLKITAVVAVVASMPIVTLAHNEAETGRSSVREMVKHRLTDGKLKACQSKEKAIQKRSVQLIRQTVTMQEKFDKIAARVQTYYTEKAVPAGKVVANYDSLVATIATKKAAVATAIAEAKSHSDGFSCEAEAPKDRLTDFRTDMLAVKAALKEYRTAIKDLIVAVRSAAASPASTSSSTAGEE